MAVRHINIHTINDTPITTEQLNTLAHRILEVCDGFVAYPDDLVLLTIDDTVEFDGVPMAVEVPLGTVDYEGVHVWPQPTQEEA